MKTKTLLILAILTLATGCRFVRRGEPLTGPLPGGSAEIERGKAAYQRHCTQCHPNGEGGLGPVLNNKPAPSFLIKTQVRVGLGVMPSFDEKQIPSDELDDLVDYMIALRKSDKRR